ncbi:MAG: hypothetical protein ACK4Y7_00705 [Caldimicrobium sp.]
MKSRIVQLFKRDYLDLEELLLEKRKIAEELYEHWKDHFLKQKDFNNLLRKYEASIHTSNHLMQTIKSFEECYICSVIETKGCCKAGLENEVTVNIFLINLFLEKEIPSGREVKGRCFFVGNNGCKLFARPYLCREFFCKRLTQKFTLEEFKELSQAIAQELTLLYALCDYIKKEINFLIGEFVYELDVTGYS